jgi:hypothetical protein
MGGRYRGIGASRIAVIAAKAVGDWPKTVGCYLTTNVREIGALAGELVLLGRKLGIIGVQR